MVDGGTGRASVEFEDPFPDPNAPAPDVTTGTPITDAGVVSGGVCFRSMPTTAESFEKTCPGAETAVMAAGLAMPESEPPPTPPPSLAPPDRPLGELAWLWLVAIDGEL